MVDGLFMVDGVATVDGLVLVDGQVSNSCLMPTFQPHLLYASSRLARTGVWAGFGSQPTAQTAPGLNLRFGFFGLVFHDLAMLPTHYTATPQNIDPTRIAI